ncbi:unnamed protein product [Meganyctiphanes norvegica]|uniref:Uncharacterized protein n=1 Tax=Meganyctiphanes norvegica TaxID=48144 RepID=A0AAV2R544_MEGNR
MRLAFLVWAALLGTGSLALPVQEKGTQENGRLTRSPQFVPNSAFLGHFQGIPVFQQGAFQQGAFQQGAFQQNPFFNQPLLVQDQSLFGQQTFGPVELVQFQNPGLLQQQNFNQFQARSGAAVEQNAANLGLNQFQVETFPQANVGVFPNGHEVDTSNLGLNPTKPTRVILQTVPVVVEILDKTTNNNEPELPGTVRTTSSFGAHRFDLGKNKPVKGQETQTPTPVETAKSLSQMAALLGSPVNILSSSASKVENIGKSATTEKLTSAQIKDNPENLPVPEALASLVAVGTPPTPVAAQRKEFVKSLPISSPSITEATVIEKTSTNQDNKKDFASRSGELQIPGFVAVDNMEMVLSMIGSSVITNANAQVASTDAPTSDVTITEAPVIKEASAAEQIVLDIMSRLSNQQSEKPTDTATPATDNIPKLLSDQGIATPVIMVLSPQVESAQDILLNTQKSATQPEFVIVIDDASNTNNAKKEPTLKQMKVGELALKIASESTTVEVPKVKVHPSAKSVERTTNIEAVPVIDPLVDVNQNLILKRLGVASNNDVGIEHIFLKSVPGTANDNLVPATVDTENNTTNTATLDDIMNSLRSQMVAMVSPSGTLILIPMVDLIQTSEPTTKTTVVNTASSTTTVPSTTAAPSSPAAPSTTAAPSSPAAPITPAAPSTITIPEITEAPAVLAAPEALIGIENIIDAMKAAHNNISLTENLQKKAGIPAETAVVIPTGIPTETAVVLPTETIDPTASSTLNTLEQVIETMEAALVTVIANNNTAVPVEVMKMIDEVISTMEASLVNVTTGKEPELLPQTMVTLNQALTNMTNALQVLNNVMTSQQNGQQVRVLGQIVPNQGIIPSGGLLQTQARNQVQPVTIRQFMTIPIASLGAQSRTGPPAPSAISVADQVANILRSRITQGATRGVVSQIPTGTGFNQRRGVPGQLNRPISLADQLGSQIAHHLIGLV